MYPSIKSCLALLIILSLCTVNSGCSDDSVGPTPEPETPTLVIGIAYYDRYNRDLRYVEKTGEFWGEPEVVHYEGTMGHHLSLVLDAQGNPHISYFQNGPDDLMYAVRGKDGWRRFTVDANGSVGFNNSIALDPQGNPHIVYQNGSTDIVMHASYLSEGNWMIEEVTGSNPTNVEMLCRRDLGHPIDYGYPIPLAIDASGTPHISWVTYGPDLDFAYAKKPANGDWEITIIDNTDNVGYFASIALDAQGNPHISYIEGLGGSDDQIMYAWKIGDGSWQKETIVAGDLADRCRYPTSIAIDAGGAPHICYFNNKHNLGYLTKSEGSGWIYEVVDDQGDVGRYCSLVLDAQGTPYVSYWDCTSDDLKCAVHYDTGWGRSIVDDAPHVGTYSSISLVYR